MVFVIPMTKSMPTLSDVTKRLFNLLNIDYYSYFTENPIADDVIKKSSQSL